MKRILYSALSGFLLAMTLQLTHSTVSIEENVQPYYNQFIKIANECEVNVNESELRIEIEHNKDSKYYAITYHMLNLIVINDRNFSKLSSIKQEQVIFHELGHAMLSLHHEDTDLNLMNTSGFIDRKTYVEYYDYFIRKLFKNCKKPLVEKFEHGSN